MNIFIYGSLCRDGLNHHVVDWAGGTFIGTVSTTPNYTLNQGMYPELLNTGTNVIFGELFDIPENTIHELDQFEGSPDLYRRQPINIVGYTDIQAYFYQLKD